VGPVVIQRIVDRLRRRIARRQVIPYWRIALRPSNARSDVADAVDMSGFSWVAAAPGHLYADPFLVDDGDRTWLFFEDYSFAEGRAAIAVAEIAPDGRVGRARTVIADDVHLSYPYVFRDGDETYMIPESGAAGAVRLYRATTFPTTWEVAHELSTEPAMDTSVIHHEDRWWFFTTLREPRGGATMLMLYSAATLTGTWESHPQNPISLDVRDSRGAGAIFRDGDRWIRPSQDGSRGYGHSFGFNEIETLSRSTYAERRIATIRPTWAPGLTATHTYSRSKRFEATDGRVDMDRRSIDPPGDGGAGPDRGPEASSLGDAT
jgi:hypothetical protein